MESHQLQLRPDPKYGENKIKEKIMFIKDRHDPVFGRPYYYSRQHEIRDRNEFLYKIKHDLGTDNIDVASQSQSEYSSLSYQSNFESYYYPMPAGYADINKGLVDGKPAEGPPEKYGFVRKNPPFEIRHRDARACAAELRKANSKLRPGEIKLSKSQKITKHVDPAKCSVDKPTMPHGLKSV